MREPPSRSYSFSLSRILSELALMCLYGVLEGQATIVKPCDSALIPVLPALRYLDAWRVARSGLTYSLWALPYSSGWLGWVPWLVRL